MGDADTKDDAPKPLGRIQLKRRPAAVVARPRDPSSRHALLVSLSEKYGVPALDLDQVCLRTEDLANVPRSLAQHHLLIPVLARNDRLFLAMKDPSLVEVIQEVEFVAGKRVYAYVAPAEDIAEAIERAYLARERGADHFIGPSCPPETLRKAGLLADPTTDRLSRESSHEAQSAPDAAPARESLSSPLRDAPVRDAGPPATVSAYPPRLSSLPPALRGRPMDDQDEMADVLSGVEQAFADLLDDASTVGPLPTEAVPEGSPPSSRQAILIADDDAESRDLLERVLLDEGYQVRTADNGRRALRMIKERTPDLLLLAAVLPEVHGFEIAHRLRGSQRYGGMPIVMISAVHRGWRMAEELRDTCGVEHFMEKPLRPADVKRAVTAAFGEHYAPADAAPDLSDLSDRAEQALADGMAAYRAGEIDRAIAHLEDGVAIDPLAYRLHFHLGLLFAQQGQTYDAIRALERAVEINSRHFAGVKNLAIMYCQAGFRNRAVELWTRGLGLAPDEETRAAIQEHLAALLSQEGLS